MEEEEEQVTEEEEVEEEDNQRSRVVGALTAEEKRKKHNHCFHEASDLEKEENCHGEVSEDFRDRTAWRHEALWDISLTFVAV